MKLDEFLLHFQSRDKFKKRNITELRIISIYHIRHVEVFNLSFIHIARMYLKKKKNVLYITLILGHSLNFISSITLYVVSLCSDR